MSNFGRRTWNREDYINNNFKKDHLSELTDLQLQQLKSKYTSYDNLLKENMNNLNKKILTTQTSTFKKGKQFGFYCELCDITYKDTLQFIDHLNSKPHLIKFENVFGEALISNTVDNDDLENDIFQQSYLKLIDKFVKENDSVRIVNEEPILKKRKKANPQQSVSSKKDINTDKISKLMGFSNFGSCKNKG